ncbi:MAG TPA: universal stress protein [Trebonia sp.]|jgi:nucleotide-binding universal stress UspA family protein|nr:universal stress protein [Trebonia sp.]
MTGIIVGIDGSHHSLRALDWAVREAAVRQAPLTVIAVYRTTVGFWGGPVTYPEDLEPSAQVRKEAEDAAAKALANAGDARPAAVTVRAVCGIPAEELVEASKGADMVVVGSRGNGGFARLLLGSVSSQVVHHAHCPVVVIPGEDRTERSSH